MGVSILLATYNGARFLEEQLNSLFAQTFRDFHLYARDDCSTDETPQILEDYRSRLSDPSRMAIMPAPRSNSGSAKHNFMRMIIDIKDDYVFLCDQDDVWEPRKIEITLAKIRELEIGGAAAADTEAAATATASTAVAARLTPALVHTDLRVVDERLRTIAPSYRRQVLHPDWDSFDFAQSMVMNIATGSTICYNRALAELIADEPESFSMYDWWLLQTALAFGSVGHIKERTVLYRQHGDNELGSSNVRSLKYKLKRFADSDSIRQRFRDSYDQAAAFHKIFAPILSSSFRAVLEEYMAVPRAGGSYARFLAMRRMGAIKYGASRMLATALFA